MPKRYPVEQRERATRMAVERLGEYKAPYACAQAFGPKLGVGAETLRKWIVQAQIDAGDRPGPTSQELGEIKRLKAEVRDLREANEVADSSGRRKGHPANGRRPVRPPLAHSAATHGDDAEVIDVESPTRSSVEAGG